MLAAAPGWIVRGRPGEMAHIKNVKFNYALDKLFKYSFGSRYFRYTKTRTNADKSEVINKQEKI